MVAERAIAVPESGRIVVHAWLRTSLAAAMPQNMRLSLQGRLRDGRRYQRTLQIRPQSGASDLAVDWGKRPVTMFVTDLPSSELAELRIAFDLVGPGKVWLDDVQAYEALLSPDEYVQVRGRFS